MSGAGIKITILGCGGSAGTPMLGGADGAGDWGHCDPAEPRNRRTRASIVIEFFNGKRLLVDTGPDLRAQLIANKIPKIDAILYTHSHADHIAGLDEVRILNRILGAPMPAFADARTMDDLRRRFDYAFRPFAGGFFFRPVFDLHLIEPNQAIEIFGHAVKIIDQDHGHSRSLGLRIGNFAYCTDVAKFPPDALAALTGLELFIVDCFTRGTPHPTHANLDQVLAWIAQLKPRRTVLTHLGPTMDYQWLRENLPCDVEPASDSQILYCDFP